MADFASAKAADLAAELGIEADRITPTGKGGRITLADVRAAGSEPGSAGRALRESITRDLAASGYQLDPREEALLDRACVTADRLAELDRVVARDGATTEGSRGQIVVHPAVSESRQLELVLLRLLSALDLPAPEGDEAKSPVSLMKRKAARARWDRRDQLERRRAEVSARG